MDRISRTQPSHSPLATEDRSITSDTPQSSTSRPEGNALLEDLARFPHRVEQTNCRRSARSRLVPHNLLPLAGYMLARQVDGRPETLEGTDSLRLADDAVRGTRARLSHGRGNVSADISGSQSESEVRAAAAQMLHLELAEMGFQRGPDPMASIYATAAMAAKVFGAGVCHNYASIAARCPMGRRLRTPGARRTSRCE